jgi:hypothetical protein
MAGKRELIEPHKGDKRYVRRDAQGRFSEVDDVGRSLAQDQKRKAKNTTTPGQGDRGDRRK